MENMRSFTGTRVVYSSLRKFSKDEPDVLRTGYEFVFVRVLQIKGRELYQEGP